MSQLSPGHQAWLECFSQAIGLVGSSSHPTPSLIRVRTGKTGNKSSESLGVTELDGAQAAIERHDCLVLRLRVYGSELLLLRFCLSTASIASSDTFVTQGIYALHKRSTLVLLSKLAESQRTKSTSSQVPITIVWGTAAQLRLDTGIFAH